jgi:hypothetical protein
MNEHPKTHANTATPRRHLLLGATAAIAGLAAPARRPRAQSAPNIKIGVLTALRAR